MIIGIGADLADIRRIQSVFEKHGARVRRRLFTEGEQAYCECQAQPLWCYAKRFAAKEAVFKAFSGKFQGRWLDIEVCSEKHKAPQLFLPPQAAHWLGYQRIFPHLSLSDEYPYALAFVVIEANL